MKGIGFNPYNSSSNSDIDDQFSRTYTDSFDEGSSHVSASPSIEFESDEEPERPAPLNSIHKVLAHKVEPNGTFSYLVKKTNVSYAHCTWIPEETLVLLHNGSNQLRIYRKNHPDKPEDPPYFDPDFLIPEFLIASRNGGKSGKEYLVKWKKLEFDFCTWETVDTINNQEMIENFEKANTPPSKNSAILLPRPYLCVWKPVVSVPLSKKGKSAKPYQIEGLNFLLACWYNRRNPILADEMGLGKTLQSTLFLMNLRNQQHVTGPFLIVGPLSTMIHWQREIYEWSKFELLLFNGSKARRKIMKDYMFFYPGTKIPKFDVLITTYEFINQEHEFFSHIDWQCIIVDEAHRLKNTNSKLITCMKLLRTDFKLCLTGTPIQNNLQELWSLLNFLDPQHFPSFEMFETKYGNPTGVVDLPNVLKPIMLRRMKGDVEKSITPLEEIIIECHMTPHQRAYYRSIYTKNKEFLQRGAHKHNSSNLQNISMELRKVCNHPYLINGAEEQIVIERRDIYKPDQEALPVFHMESLIKSSAKMILLDKLLAKLKADKHRVLIFSQMTRLLDIVSDYLVYKGYRFQRIDGNIRGDERQKAIDSFNSPDSQDFVFLLCTKAGGMGINLTTADTVIIYDSDWNPQNDIQATARCHRIGQTKGVKVYRFITAKSYERKMFDRASMKLGFDKAVLEGGNAKSKIEAEELDKLLRYGAYYAFEDDDKEDEKAKDEDIDQILSHAQVIKHEQHGEGNNTFSKAIFQVEEEDDSLPDLDNPNFWQKYLPVTEDIKIEPRNPDRHKRDSTTSFIRYEDEDIGDHCAYNPISFWTKTRVQSLMTSMLRFGWGRWRQIIDSSQLDCETPEIIAICHAFLGWLLASTNEQFPIIEIIFKSSLPPDITKYEKKFNKKLKNENEQYIISGAQWKLNRIIILYFIHREVDTCPKKPEEIIVPDVSNPPAAWWTKEDDQALIYGTWQYGYQQYHSIKFSQQDINLTTKQLNKRIKALTSAYKQIYLRYKETQGSSELPFNHDTLLSAMNTWTKRDHKIILQTLLNIGNPGKERFFEEANLTNKTPDQVYEYLQKILKYINNGTNSNDFPDQIAPTTAQKILTRIKLFEFIRDYKNNPKLSPREREIFEYIDSQGFHMTQFSTLICDTFGVEAQDVKILKRMKELAKQFGVSDKYFEISTRVRDSYAPAYSQAYSGPISFPLRLSSTLNLVNLGKVVYDRDTFHNDRYIYPAGYESEKLSFSIFNPAEKCWYRSLIIDRGLKEPVFRVEVKNNSKYYFEGNAPSNPWLAVLKAVDDKRKEMGMDVQKSKTVSGPEFYGLAHSVVKNLLAKMENADKCKKFMSRINQDDRSDDNDYIEEPVPEKEKKACKKRPMKASSAEPILLDFGTLFKAARARMQIKV